MRAKLAGPFAECSIGGKVEGAVWRHLPGLTLIVLDRALAEHRPEIHHSHQGIQYAVTAYIQMLRAAGAEISLAEWLR